jgi:uncharacterized protein YjlB
MKLVSAPFIITPYLLTDDGRFPNNARLPVVLYKRAVAFPMLMPLFFIRRLLRRNHWYNFWKAGVFTYHHYHSNTHELLLVYKGNTRLQLGGDNGVIVEVSRGDMVLIPAGVAHKNLGDENSIKCLGAYPYGKTYDMNYGNPGERPRTDNLIPHVLIPECDPLMGKNGPLQQYWK